MKFLRTMRVTWWVWWMISAAVSVRAGAQAAADGAPLYEGICAGCHAADGSGSAKGPAIAKLPATIAKSDAELMRIVRDGVPGKGMPGMQALGDERIAALVHYLRVLQGVGGMSRDAGGAKVAHHDGTVMSGAPGLNSQISEARAGVHVADVAHDEKAVMNGAPGSDLASLDVTEMELNQKTAGANWVSYNGDYSGRRYSALGEVTVKNAAQLEAKWRFHTAGAGILQVTPVVVDGVMFVTRSNDVWALNAATGKMLWHHARAVSDGLIDDASGHINRGVAVLGTRVYSETDNAHLVCLDARTGKEIWDVLYATGNSNYGATSAPLIVKDKVLVGTSGGDDGVRGFVAAFDAATGKEAWRFWTIPALGEKGAESWPGEMYLHGGGTTWMPGTYDAELNTIYWGTGNPSPDFDGSVRPGDDLYTSSLLALDPDTGKLKWHFQFSPHDLYDYDAVQTPVLIDSVFAGKLRKLVITANRNGFLYILDRTNGTFLFAKQFSASMNWAKGIDAQGRPISAGLIPDEKGVTVCPGYSGATNWYSPSYDVQTGMFYFRSLESCTLFRANTEKFVDGREYYSTGAEAPVMANPPDSGTLNAFNVGTLDFAWRVPLDGPENLLAGVMSMAGGVVAFGNDKREFELDEAMSGKKLWAVALPAGMHASPMAYGVGGREYFAVAAGDDVIAFGLK